ncbi:MAG: hypothetical protein JO116_10185 [Planctomycetaceae bacterium]|nr:hypothetical protein [Planctomycetaceae bacterium]
MSTLPGDSPICQLCQTCVPSYRDGRCVEDWKLTRRAIRDENMLIGQRMSWLPVTQGRFGAVFAFYLRDAKDTILALLGHLGVVVANAPNHLAYYMLLIILISTVPD